MSINNLNTYLNVRDAHLRVVSGNVYAQAMNIGGINVETAHGLQSVSNTGNATSLTLEFANVTTGFVTTANVQIGRDLVVTGNATVSKELTVTSNAIVSSNLNVSDDLIVTNNILASNNLTVTGNLNVTTIMSDSNVVAEYTGPHDRPLRKYPEVAMTQNDESATSGYVASASSTATYNTDLQPENAFNGVISPSSGTASWQSSDSGYSGTTPFNYLNSGTHTVSLTDTDGTVHYGDWLSLQTPNRIKVSYYKIHTLNDVDNYRPDSFVLLGSNSETDGTWKLLHTETGGMTDPGPEVYTGHVNSTEFYTYHRLLVKSLAGNGGEVYINELEYYGHEEGSGSLDTTLKTVFNVPATTGTQLEVYYDAKDLTTMPSTVTDLSPNTNTGTPSNITVSDGAFVFNGTSSLLESSTTIVNPTGDTIHAFSLWVKPSAGDLDDAGNHYLIIYGTELNTGKWSGISISNKRFASVIHASVVRFGPEVRVGEWYHITLNYKGGGIHNSERFDFFINGLQIDTAALSTGGSQAGSATLNLSSPAKVVLGGLFTGAERSSSTIANARLYSKALNADQIKELYDYQKDYFLGSKSQVTLYKGHLGVGVTEPSGQLELAGDERIQEYPPRAMTGYKNYFEGHGVFEVENSSVANSNYRSFDAFDKDEDPLVNTAGWVSGLNTYDTSGTGLASGGSATDYFSTYGPGSWLKLKLPYAIKLKSSKFSIRAPSNTLEPLKSFTIYGSRDNTNWNALYSQSTSTSQSFSIDINSTEYYKCFVIHITEVDHNQGYAGIVEWRLFGTPGPTTLDKGSLTLGRSLDVPRISRYDVDTETPRPEKLVVDFDTTVNSTPTDISGKGNHGTFNGTNTNYSAADKAFVFDGSDDYIDIPSVSGVGTGAWVHSKSFWFKLHSSTDAGVLFLLGRNSSTKQIAVQSNGSGQFQYYIYGCNSKVQVNGSDWFPEVNRWYHCVTIFKNNETTATGGVITGREMYIDGVKQTLIAINNQVSLNLDSSEVRFGNQFNAFYLDYELSNPKLYSVALEPSEVRKLYNLGRTGRSMVISDTAVGIGKAPEAQLDVRGILKASVGLFPDRPSFMCPVALFGAKSIPTSTTMYDYSTRDGLTLANRGVGSSAMRWKLGVNGRRHTNTMYPTNNVKLVRVFDDTTSETSGVQVPYEGYYLCHNFVRSNAGGYNMGNSFITYSESQQKYITASINAYMLPWGGGHSGQGSDYMMQFVSAVLYLRPNDKVIFSFWNQTSYSGGFEQYVSLVML